MICYEVKIKTVKIHNIIESKQDNLYNDLSEFVTSIDLLQKEEAPTVIPQPVPKPRTRLQRTIAEHRTTSSESSDESADDSEDYFDVDYVLERTVDSEHTFTDEPAVDETEPAQDAFIPFGDAQPEENQGLEMETATGSASDIDEDANPQEDPPVEQEEQPQTIRERPEPGTCKYYENCFFRHEESEPDIFATQLQNMAISDQTNDERSRYAKESVVVMDIFPKMTRELVHDIINPTVLFYVVQNSSILNRFTQREKDMVDSLVSNGYNECDVDFIYRIVWQYLPKPRRGWSKLPENSDLSLGDDIQRIYLGGESFYSRPRVEISCAEFTAFFKEFKDVAKRIDQFLQTQAHETFLCKISNIESNKFDNSYKETYIKKSRNIEDMRGSEVEMMNLVVTGVMKEKEVVEKFLKANSSEELFQTEIEDIQSNRVVLMIKVKGQSLQSKDQFMEKMLKFLVNVLTPEEENEFPNLTIDTVIIGIADRITLENPPTPEELVKYAQGAEGYNLFLCVSLNKQFDLKSPDDGYLDISDCTILSKKMVFTDSKGLLIYDTTNDATDYIPLSEKPRYVTEIDNDTVAVSSEWDWNIKIISLTTKHVSMTIQTSGYCYGVSFYNNKLYAAFKNCNKVDVQVIDRNSKNEYQKRNVLSIYSDSVRYITVNGGKLFYTDNSFLYCCDLKGKIQWKFSDDKYLCLFGVTSDGNGNAFVSCLSAHAVLLVSGGGKKCREILNRSNGLTLPRGIHFAQHENLLLVCNNIGKVSLVDAR
ncbi:unnamed protein product [Mytilus coruscus]|uniref:DZIP3-like HEPN domain-containing protein n=1 Tax=Mytilus coruscus TaxID=42192 RepID=A0A6J8BIV9_MYTCO|nr:unnamed protein product [Mytilus coruscus]